MAYIFHRISRWSFPLSTVVTIKCSQATRPSRFERRAKLRAANRNPIIIIEGRHKSRAQAYREDCESTAKALLSLCAVALFITGIAAVLGAL